MKYNVLVLTDHSGHNIQNSLYNLLQGLLKHELCEKLVIASKGNPENKNFFNANSKALFVSKVTKYFRFDYNGECYKTPYVEDDIKQYDLILLRMPPPLNINFLNFIEEIFQSKCIINKPNGVARTGTKKFLLNFPDLCPEMKLCYSLDDIIEFKNKFPIVLKPLNGYGGKGIIKIDGDRVFFNNDWLFFDEFASSFNNEILPILGVKFLKNVIRGDKRILVVNGTILGASLRLPAPDSWLCNAAMGGTSSKTKVDKDEKVIIETINPVLEKLGVFIYGIDTLVGDAGKRVLSEINTTSIGGIKQIDESSNKPIIDEIINLIWDYFLKNKNGII